MSKLKQNIKKLLAHNGITQKEAAIKAGLSETAVRDILVGRSKNPRYDTLEKIGKIFNCSPDELIGISKSSYYVSPLKKLRNKVGLSVCELSERTKIPSYTIRRIEDGILIPTFDLLERLAKSLKCSPKEIFYINNSLNENLLSVLARTVPLILLENTPNINNIYAQDNLNWVCTSANIGLRSYAIEITDKTMEPKLPFGSIAIIDPDDSVTHSSYVIVQQENDVPRIKEYIEDGYNKYIRDIHSYDSVVDINNKELYFYGKIKQLVMYV